MRHISRRKVKTFLWGLFFALPWLVGFIVLTAFPIGQSLYNSFTDFSIFKPAKWVGLKNYVNLFTRDRLFYKAILNTLYMVVVAMPVTLLMGLLNLVLSVVLTVVNPIFGALYTFFFSNIIGKQLSKAVFTSGIICGVVFLLGYFGCTVICVSAAALSAYIPLAIVLLLLWFLIGWAL